LIKMVLLLILLTVQKCKWKSFSKLLQLHKKGVNDVSNRQEKNRYGNFV